MNSISTGNTGDEHGSWATESLPMSLRKELLERDLKKAGARAGSASATAGDEGPTSTSSSHPQSEGSGEERGS